MIARAVEPLRGWPTCPRSSGVERILPSCDRTLHASAREDLLAPLKPTEPLERPRCRHSRDLPQHIYLHVTFFCNGIDAAKVSRASRRAFEGAGHLQRSTGAALSGAGRLKSESDAPRWCSPGAILVGATATRNHRWDGHSGAFRAVSCDARSGPCVLRPS